MATIIVLSIIWFLFSSLAGFIEAHYYDMHPENKNHDNLHIFYTVQRAIVAGLMVYEIAVLRGIIEGSIFFVALLFTFSFFHNGFYYLTRHKLNPEIYPKGFFDDSETSTAIIELGAKFRTAMAVIGIIFIIGLIIS